jgi:hypothetical protein
MSDGAGDDSKSQFRKSIETAINSHSMENGSDTPDYILAEYLVGCLEAFDRAVTKRTAWYDKDETDLRRIEEVAGRMRMPPPTFVDRNKLSENDDSE